jgi:hypothetical protein
VVAIPDGARRALVRQLQERRQQRWPDLGDLQVRYRGDFAYIAGARADDEHPLPLCRLRYLGSPEDWGFAVYLASKDGYEDSILPQGSFTGTPAEALDCACGLYLNDPTAWWDARDDQPTDSRKNF